MVGGGDGDVLDEWVLVRPPTAADDMTWPEFGKDVERTLKVLFTTPASHWTDAAPIGNGRLGAMVWGGVGSEKLQLNHDTLWTGVPGTYTNVKAPAVLSNVRALVDNGKYAQATNAALGLSGDPSDVYQPLGDINLDFGEVGEYTSYERVLDLSSATVKVSYISEGVKYTREFFSSNPHQVIATRISAEKVGTISFTASFDSQLLHQVTADSGRRIILEGSCLAKRIPPRENDVSEPNGIRFSGILDLQIGGVHGRTQVLDGKKIKVDGADWAVLLVVAHSTFEGPFTSPLESKLNPTSACLETLSRTGNMSFSQLKIQHLDDYQKLFGRVSLQLSQESITAVEASKLQKREDQNEAGIMPKSTAERVKAFKDDEDPSMVELLFHYGRYLLISCSRPTTQISNLQGLWSKDVEPAWDAAPHLNINLQMNYWPALPCNLSECQEPLFDFIASLAVNGTKTAKINYEANGWVTHQVSDIWAKTSPDRGDAVWALWPMGGAWLATHLWEHYKFTMDKGFLENTAYPVLEGAAAFLLDWLIERQDGYLETNPSTSPEHSFIAPDGKTASVSYSTTMDLSIIREVFSAILSSSAVLGKSTDGLVERIEKTLPRIPAVKVARDGSIMEWALDFADPDTHHRHLSHLFGLFPGHTITLDKTPDLCKAAENSLYKRGDAGPGWSTAWKMALWARLHNSEHAYNMIKQLFVLVDPDHEADFEGGLYSNLFTAHPPFQIDANFGFTAAVAEMLVQSTEHDIYLLPAVPRDKWPAGCVKGFKARGGVTVNICWKQGALHEALLCCHSQNSLQRIHCDGNVASVRLSPGNVYRFSKSLKCLEQRPLI